MYQIGINANSELRLSDKDWLQGTLFFNIANNYDKFNYKTPPADTDALPRVRTWVREYVDSSNILLNNLQLTHMEQFGQEWYGQAYGGYLEMMYAGVGERCFIVLSVSHGLWVWIPTGSSSVIGTTP